MSGWFRHARKSNPSLRRRLEVEVLEGRVMPSVTVIESEPNDDRASADAFVFPTSDGTARLRGRAADNRDNDFFTFTLRATSTLNIDVGTTNGRFAKLEIENSQGNDLFATDPSSSINRGSVTLNAGQYFVRLKTQGTAAAAAYDVTLNLANPNAGGGIVATNRIRESEPNNVRTSADFFRLVSNAAQLVGTSFNREERDFFVFAPAQSGRLNFQVRATNGVFAQLEVQNAQGATLFETDPNSGINSGSVAVAAGQQYFIRLRAVDTRAASYEAMLTLTP